MKLVYYICFPLLLVMVSACSKIPTLDDVIPDTRTDYKRSRTLPDLEVPPDLTLEQDDNLKIPGEAEPTTLSAFQRQQKRGGLSELELLSQQYPGEKVLPVPGTATEIWSELITYWDEKGYSIELEDAELGVLETDWHESSGDGYRDKFKIFAEPTEDGKNSILFVSSERQEKIALGDGEVEWLDQEPDESGDKKVVAEIKRIFYGDEPVVATTTEPANSSWTEPASSASVKRAEIARSVDNKIYLDVPDEFSIAWQQTEELLNGELFYLEDKDPEKGLFYIVYAEDGDSSEKEEGWLNKLKFWGDDEESGKSYQISLTGVGDKTEIVVLNDEGDWISNEEADSILTILMDEYNGY